MKTKYLLLHSLSRERYPKQSQCSNRMVSSSSSARAFVAALIFASGQVADARINGSSHNHLQQQEELVQTSSHAQLHPRRRRQQRRQQEQITSKQVPRNEHVDILRETDGSGAPSSYTTHIVGGNRATFDRYPYFVSVYTKLQGGNYHVCGATLIENDVVLCAAHCADHADFVRVGAYRHPDIPNNGGAPYHDSKVASRHVHPKFFSDSRDRLHNDAMLLKLSRPVTDTELLQYRMRLDRVEKVDQTLDDADSLTAIGLGRINEDGSVSRFLKEVELKYMSNDKCSLYFGDLPSQMMCAKETNVDACEGDSGGPLILKGNGPRGDVQTGIISWGSGCANNFPGVYTRIAKVKDWIDSTICEISPSNCRANEGKDENDAVRLGTTSPGARNSRIPEACEDDAKYCGKSMLPKNVFCFINGNACPVTCGRCDDN